MNQPQAGGQFSTSRHNNRHRIFTDGCPAGGHRRRRGVREFSCHPQTLAVCHRHFLRPEQRPAAVQRRNTHHLRFTLRIPQGPGCDSAPSPGLSQRSRLRVSGFHCSITIPGRYISAGNGSRLSSQTGDRGGHGYLRVSEHALCFQLTANGLCQYGLFRTLSPLTCATLSSPAFTLAQISGQPGIADITVRFTDDGWSFVLPCQRYMFTLASFMAISALPVPVRCPTVGYQDLYVMTCGTVQQG